MAWRKLACGPEWNFSKSRDDLIYLKDGQKSSNYAETSERFLSPFAKNKNLLRTLCLI